VSPSSSGRCGSSSRRRTLLRRPRGHRGECRVHQGRHPAHCIRRRGRPWQQREGAPGGRLRRAECVPGPQRSPCSGGPCRCLPPGAGPWGGLRTTGIPCTPRRMQGTGRGPQRGELPLGGVAAGQGANKKLLSLAQSGQRPSTTSGQGAGCWGHGLYPKGVATRRGEISWSATIRRSTAWRSNESQDARQSARLASARRRRRCCAGEPRPAAPQEGRQAAPAARSRVAP